MMPSELAPAGFETRVLIADDVTLMRELLKGILHRLGYRNVHEEGNGELVVRSYRKLHPDVVMLDIDMPQKDGIEALREILQQDPHAFVVMVSAASTLENVQMAIKSGAKGFVVKPYTTKRIQDVMLKYQREKG